MIFDHMQCNIVNGISALYYRKSIYSITRTFGSVVNALYQYMILWSRVKAQTIIDNLWEEYTSDEWWQIYHSNAAK